MAEIVLLHPDRNGEVGHSAGTQAVIRRDLHEAMAAQPAPPNGLVASLEKRRLRAYLLLFLMDTALLPACFALTGHLYFTFVLGGGRIETAMLSSYLLLPLYQTIALYNGTYRRKTIVDWRAGAAPLLVALILSSALLSFFVFFAKMGEDFSRVVFLSGLGLSGLVMLFWRMVFSHLVRRYWGETATNRLVIEAGGPVLAVKGYHRVDAARHDLRPDLSDPAALDRIARYLRNMDEVLVSCSQGDQIAWAEVLKGAGVHGEVTSEFARRIGAIGVVHHEDAGVSALLVSNGPLSLRARAAKRAFDLGLALTALILLSPVCAVMAALIKLEDGGPVFFRQRRMGRGNAMFDILKFRTMRVEQTDASGTRSASHDDERITRIGRLLRRTSMDELPQLLNVVVGEMAIVGPRPHALGSQAGSKLFWEIDRRYWHRHSLRPGMTGLAQVRGYRGATDTERDLSDRLHSDLEYLRAWNLWRDVKIIVATLGVLMHRRAF